MFIHISMSWLIHPWLRTLILEYCGVNFTNRKTVFIGTDVLFDLSGEIYIGENVTITTGTKIMTHYFDPTEKNYRRGVVEVHDGVFIGMNTLIVNDVKIESNSTIGAGSVVNNNIPTNTIAAGVPAKIIKSCCLHH